MTDSQGVAGGSGPTHNERGGSASDRSGRRTGLTGCRDCRAELEHCDGTLVVHAGGHVECLDHPWCVPDEDRHDPAGGCEVVLACRCG